MVSVSRNMPNFEESGGEGGRGQQEPPPQPPHSSQHHNSQPSNSMMLGTGGTTRASKLTPYDSLKELVKKKRQRAVLGGVTAGGVTGVGEGVLPQGLPPPPPVIATHAHRHHGSNNNIVQVVGHQHHQQQHLGIGGPPPVKHRKMDVDMPLVAAAASSSATVSASSVSNHHHHHHDDNNIHLQQYTHTHHAQHASSSLKHSVSAPVFKPSNFLRQALYPTKFNKQSSTFGMARHTSLSSFDAFFANNKNSNITYGSNINTTFSGDGRLQRVLEHNNNNNAFLNNVFNLKSLPDRLQAQQQQQQPPESALHRACCRGDGVAIRRHLQQHPFDAGHASQLKTLKKRYNGMFRIVETRRLPERYTLPINLAIRHGVRSDALRELARLAPQALTTPDGPNQEISIHVLLSHLPWSLLAQKHLAMVDLILLKYPMVAKAKDRLLNLPLHVACRHGCPLDVVRHVCIMYPDALFMLNFHGLTPIDLANRHHNSSSNSDDEAVVNYLWEAVAEQTEPMLLDAQPYD